MKKKGLIISTIVMVVVLIASLTTATYAWFNAASSVKVDQIALSIDSNAAVSIGAHSGAGNTQDDYMFNQVTLGHGAANAATANTPTYSNGETGLGTTLGFATETSLKLTTGVGTAESIVEETSVTNPDASAFNPAHVVYKANSGASDTVIDNETVYYANANEDYIVLKMGAQAAQTAVKGIYAQVVVKTTDTATTLKMNAALHFYIKVGNAYTAEDEESVPEHKAGTFNGTYKTIEFDLFNDTANHAGTSKSVLGTTGHQAGGATGVVLSYESNQAVATFNFLIAGVNNTTGTDLKTDGSGIIPFEIYAYVWGPDQDCVSTATGCALTMDIEFKGVKTEAFAGTFLTLE